MLAGMFGNPPRNPPPGFDPDGPASGPGIFGLPFTPEEAQVILIPVPWEATVCYGAGTAGAPAAIYEASRQVDLFDREIGHAWERGIAMLPIPEEVRSWSDRARGLALRVMHADEDPGSGPAAGTAASSETGSGAPHQRRSGPSHASLEHAIEEVDRLSEMRNAWVRANASTWLDRGRMVGVVGGDHSCPFSLIQILSQRHPGLGILHVDAHFDLRDSYQGFRWSHASIFWNVLNELPGVKRIVSVGVREYGQSEDSLVRSSGGRVHAFFDADLRRRLQEGEPWSRIAGEVIRPLPPDVYVSFDVDGLEPSLCPLTGTPVPGGLSFAEAVSLLRLVADSGHRIVGFDLSEVGTNPQGGPQLDANFGARLLYKIIGYACKPGPGRAH